MILYSLYIVLLYSYIPAIEDLTPKQLIKITGKLLNLHNLNSPTLQTLVQLGTPKKVQKPKIPIFTLPGEFWSP